MSVPPKKAENSPASVPREDETYRISDNPVDADPLIPPLAGHGESESRSARKPGASRHTASAASSKSVTGGVMFLMGCNLIVFASSVCIMVLELTASRLVSKHVGSSLYTWTSVIGVVLAGITIGNYLGGMLADRFPPRKSLCWLFFIASVLCISVLWLDQYVPNFDRGNISWPTWIVIVVTAIFLWPSIALGTISPVVASLALSRSARTGITVGNVYAWGALGSIVGTFLTGFFLIDAFGTKAIVGMTAGTLAMLGVFVAAGQVVFRTALLVGWMQFLVVVVLLASARRDSFGQAGELLGRAVTGNGDATSTDSWRNFGADVGELCNRLGLTLGLRDDAVNEYHDESNYSYINVGRDTLDGEQIKYLKLDKLIHSYYNPSDPTALYYEYEQIYAAITEQLVQQRSASYSIALPKDFTQREKLADSLPEGLSFDKATGVLEVSGPLGDEQRRELLSVATSAAYWNALETLRTRSADEAWVGLTSESLSELPAGTQIPEDLESEVFYDTDAELLNAYERITPADFDRLVRAAPESEYYRAIEELYAKSRQIDTLSLGGGGFIFPRWIEAHYPASGRIDVAELDPAVELAVRRELGLGPESETAITAHIGDARNYVDDRLRANRELRNRGEAPVLYDFVYGDAFNDFSVPWHLTTVEFAERVRQLLTDNGAFLANIIEIYPRTEAPEGDRRESVARYRGTLPKALFSKSVSAKDWTPADDPFGNLLAQRVDDDTYRLQYLGTMSEVNCDYFRQKSSDREFQLAITGLYSQSNMPNGLPDLPEELIDSSAPVETWVALPPPYTGMEVYRVHSHAADAHAERRPGDLWDYVLAVRGRMPRELRDRLKQLDDGSAAFRSVVDELYRRSQQVEAGGFLGRYTNTAAKVFPHLYLFSTSWGQPTGDRDTFVLVCSMQPIDLEDFEHTNPYWEALPFAWLETDEQSGERRRYGQMDAVLGLADGLVLTDDFAPVDNLLSPVFARQDN